MVRHTLKARRRREAAWMVIGVMSCPHEATMLRMDLSGFPNHYPSLVTSNMERSLSMGGLCISMLVDGRVPPKSGDEIPSCPLWRDPEVASEMFVGVQVVRETILLSDLKKRVAAKWVALVVNPWSMTLV